MDKSQTRMDSLFTSMSRLLCEYKTKLEIFNCLPNFSNEEKEELWECLKEENSSFFAAYKLRIRIINQIYSFNQQVKNQAEFMRSQCARSSVEKTEPEEEEEESKSVEEKKLIEKSKEKLKSTTKIPPPPPSSAITPTQLPIPPPPLPRQLCSQGDNIPFGDLPYNLQPFYPPSRFFSNQSFQGKILPDVPNFRNHHHHSFPPLPLPPARMNFVGGSVMDGPIPPPFSEDSRSLSPRQLSFRDENVEIMNLMEPSNCSEILSKDKISSPLWNEKRFIEEDQLGKKKVIRDEDEDDDEDEDEDEEEGEEEDFKDKEKEKKEEKPSCVSEILKDNLGLPLDLISHSGGFEEIFGDDSNSLLDHHHLL